LTMKTLIKYPGSKWRIADWIISFLPSCKTYLEPFFGSGAVFFKKPRSRIETINDLDGNVVNFFSWVRDDPERLARQLYAIPYARDVYEQAHSENFHGKEAGSLQKAVNFCIRLNMGHGYRTTGDKVGWKSDIHGRERAYAAMDWASLPERIIEAAERLRGVQIENQDAVKLMKRYNFPDVLIYLDPPYMPGTRNQRPQYAFEMDTAEEHEELLQAALMHSGPVVISGYDSDLYNNILRDWHKVTTVSNTHLNVRKTECLWMNFEPAKGSGANGMWRK